MLEKPAVEFEIALIHILLPHKGRKRPEFEPMGRRCVHAIR
jgi:hypothetical protein